MRKILPSIFGAFILIHILSTMAFSQGVTTASIVGKVQDNTGEPLPGAQVVAVHTPTGSTFGNVTDDKGKFRLPNLQVGGPYKVTISFVGYQSFQQEGIYLQIGQQYAMNVTVQEEAQQLEEISITAQGLIDEDRTGPATTVDREQLENLPTVDRSLNDYMRLTPQASLTGNGGISFAGINNRFNAIYIDGAVNNDVFGLASSGTNGGQTGVSPISIDALEQIQVVTSPYDVSKGGFAGAGINAVTRSGKNYLEGSAYYLTRNEKLAGYTSQGERLNDFSSKIYGFRLGGPIVKDKLFFFTNVEVQRDRTPYPFPSNTYVGNATTADLNNLVSFLGSEYGYDPGAYQNPINELDGTKFLAKLDWNISQKHKLSFRHSYVRAIANDLNRSSNTTLYFANTGNYFPSTTNSSALELRSVFSNSVSNHLTLGLTSVRDDRDVIGQPFPQVQIGDGDATIILGTDNFSYANIVNQDVFTITDNLTLYKGQHTITLGTHNEFFKIQNLFTIFSTPRYSYGSLDDFYNDQGGFYLFGHELPTNDGDQIRLGDNALNVGPTFNAMQLGFYVQDEIAISDRFKVSPGLRIDIPVYLDNAPLINDDFNTNTVAAIEAVGYDLQGAQAGVLPKTRIHWSPRVGFNWDVTGEQMVQIRGGIGIFTSRVPWVWPGGMYIRNGLTSGLSLGVAPFYPNPEQWRDNLITNLTKPTGDVDLYAADFKYPQVLRASIGADFRLPYGMVGTAEFLYTKNINNIYVQNVNVVPSTVTLTGTPDDRILYDNSQKVDSKYNNITYVSNTAMGYTWNGTVSVARPAVNGFGGSIAYSYTDAMSQFDGQGSINNENWNYREQVNGRNNPSLAPSLFDAGSRIVATLDYRKEYADHLATRISLVFTGQSGSPFSYVYNDNGALNSEVFSTGTDAARNLVYIPSASDEIVFGEVVEVNGEDVVQRLSEGDQAAMWTQLDGFISNNDYLNAHRGEYAERYSDRSPFTGIFDLKISQDFFITTATERRHTFTVGFNVFNVANLLNRDWGKRYIVGDASNPNYRMLTYLGKLQDGTTPAFSFTTPPNAEPWTELESGINSSLWQGQIELRYTF